MIDRKTLIVLLQNGAAAIETSGDLNTEELKQVAIDLAQTALDLETKDNLYLVQVTTPDDPYPCVEYLVHADTEEQCREKFHKIFDFEDDAETAAHHDKCTITVLHLLFDDTDSYRLP